jgi:ABC-type multidrug transport system ATPase subunit
VASGASLWLLDEPLNGLDAEGSERLALVIDSMRRSGCTVVVASHSPPPGEWRLLEIGG